MFHAVQLILTIDIIREFVMSLQVIIYAKQNGAQMATFAATGTRADIDDLRKTMAALGTRLIGDARISPAPNRDRIHCDPGLMGRGLGKSACGS